MTKIIIDNSDEQIHSKTRIQLAIEVASIGIWDWNLITNLITWDKVMYDIYGTPLTENNVVEYNTWKSAVVLEDFVETEKQLKSVTDTGFNKKRIFRIHRKSDNSLRYIQAAERAIYNSDQIPTHIVGINMDITEFKLNELALIEANRRLEYQNKLITMIGDITTRNTGYIAAAGQIAAK